MKVSDPELFKKSTKILKSTIENIPMIRQSWKNLKYPDFSAILSLKCIVSVRIESHNQLKCSIIILEMICGFTVCLSSSDLHRSISMNFNSITGAKNRSNKNPLEIDQIPLDSIQIWWIFYFVGCLQCKAYIVGYFVGYLQCKKSSPKS